MNYLAHIYLAEPTPEAQLGALLGDFKGAHCKPDRNSILNREIVLHQLIDKFTDSHPAVLNAKSYFRPETRRFSGILLDIFFDHRLSCDWSKYCATELSLFIEQFYSDVQVLSDLFSPRFAEAFPKMVSEDWLGSYLEFEGVVLAAKRVSRRLTKSGELLREGINDLEQNYALISACFDTFFPELVEYSQEQHHLVCHNSQALRDLGS